MVMTVRTQRYSITPDKGILLDFLPSITASFAQPAAENPTVAMIEAAYQHHGLHFRYINFEVAPENLADAVRGARAMNWAGFNCSIPHKLEVIQHLDGLGESASIMKAVNCVVRRDGKYIGENTDGKGFVESLKEKVDPAGKTITILGAGGAARAIAVETALAGASHITIVNRTLAKAQELAQLVTDNTSSRASAQQWQGDYNIAAGTNVIVNATSIGLFPDIDARVPINLDTVTPDMVVADVIPNPPYTNLIKQAADRGATVLEGIGMLVNQGVVSIKYWTGQDVDPAIMRAKIEDIFS
jgi:shikimate dehydrogenase